LLSVFTRILLVLVAVAMAALLRYFGVVSEWSALGAMIVLLVVLLLPVERITRLSLKSVRTEGSVEIAPARRSRGDSAKRDSAVATMPPTD
jgi:hypothetical protein